MNPYDEYKNRSIPSQSQSPSYYEWNSPTPQGETRWSGTTYRYSANGGQQPQSEPPYGGGDKDDRMPRRWSWKKVLCGALACVMISVGSIGGFVAAVNNGYVALNTTASQSEGALQTASSSAVQATANKTGELTPQQIAKKVIPSVVCIQNYQINTNANALSAWGSQAAQDTSAVSPASEGSGIIATADGYIITNAHVVDGATSLKVILSDGNSYEAKLVGSDSVTDLALIKIEATGLPAAEFGSSADLQVADTVMAVGNPGGMEFNSSVTIGYISALNREITNSQNGYTMKCIQTDAAINPGNSGGALVNTSGQVIGINSAKIVATGYEGLGFAIPIDLAQPIINDLKDYGYVKDRAMLGITGEYIDRMSSRFYGLPMGYYVASVRNPSVSAAGIEPGDVITAIDNKPISTSTTISVVVASKKPGEQVTLQVARPSTGKTFTAKVALAQSTGK